jgi:hypothetical protein
MAPQSKGVKNSKKQTIEHYKSQFLNLQNIPCMLLLLKLKNDL